MSGETGGLTRPPGPPRHTHDDGATCMWIRRYSIDRWRLVDKGGNDLGPCPGLMPVSGETGGKGPWWDLSTPHFGRGLVLLFLVMLGLDIWVWVIWHG